MRKGDLALRILFSGGDFQSSLWKSYNSVGRPVSKDYAVVGSFLASTQATRALVTEGDTAMLDITMLAIGLGLFVATVGYCYLCDRL